VRLKTIHGELFEMAVMFYNSRDPVDASPIGPIVSLLSFFRA